MIEVLVQRGEFFEKVPDLVLQLGAEYLFSRLYCPGAADLALPGKIRGKGRVFRNLRALVALGGIWSVSLLFRNERVTEAD